jgi:hypothetical protein
VLCAISMMPIQLAVVFRVRQEAPSLPEMSQLPGLLLSNVQSSRGPGAKRET